MNAFVLIEDNLINGDVEMMVVGATLAETPEQAAINFGEEICQKSMSEANSIRASVGAKLLGHGIGCIHEYILVNRQRRIRETTLYR